MDLQPIQFFPKFIGQKEADNYFSRLLNEISWQKMEWKQGRYLPRLIYRYDIDQYEKVDVLDELRSFLENIFGVYIGGIFCNQYQNGNDWTPEHQDSYGTDAFTLSFGETRKFYFRNLTTNQKLEYDLSHGDLIYFNEMANSQHKHCIPKTSKQKDVRISIVFFVHNKT